MLSDFVIFIFNFESFDSILILSNNYDVVFGIFT